MYSFLQTTTKKRVFTSCCLVPNHFSSYTPPLWAHSSPFPRFKLCTTIFATHLSTFLVATFLWPLPQLYVTLRLQLQLTLDKFVAFLKKKLKTKIVNINYKNKEMRMKSFAAIGVSALCFNASLFAPRHF